jgi:hypothetical protein
VRRSGPTPHDVRVSAARVASVRARSVYPGSSDASRTRDTTSTAANTRNTP